MMEVKLLGFPKEIPLDKLLFDKEITDNFRRQGMLKPTQLLTKARLYEIAEKTLKTRMQNGSQLAHFQLGQMYFEEENYISARVTFNKAVEKYRDLQSMFQLAVIHHDGLGCDQDQKKGVSMMKTIAESKARNANHILFPAAFNLGRAYYLGCGTKEDSEQALKWWLFAADDGNPKGSVLAQTYLGYLYSTENFLNLKKAFFWHMEACSNGSLESQGVLGVMYLYGMGTDKSWSSSFQCLREAAERRNVYAQGTMAFYYYHRKMFCSAVEAATSIAFLEELDQVAAETACAVEFIIKGVAMANFIFARCLEKGLGVKKNAALSGQYFSRAFHLDHNLCAKFVYMSNRNEL